MKNSKIYFILIFIIFFSIFSSKIYAANNVILNQENVYLENEFFKVIYLGKEKNPIMPINSLKIFNKQTNALIDEKLWSSAVLLNNGNLLLGEYKNNQFLYYELDKQLEKTFLISLDYYIKNIDKDTGNYIILNILDSKNNSFSLGIIDKEFNIVLKPIFEYKETDFSKKIDILKVFNGKYGLYSIYGKEIIQPIFDNLSFNDETKNTINAVYQNKPYTLEKIEKGYKNITTLKNIDVWARDSVLNCINLGIVSDSLQLKFKENITRQEFCELIVKLYEIKTGIKIDLKNQKNPFFDTDNDYILKAYKLGIINGKTKNQFEPNSFLTREEAAVIISNLIKAMGISTKIDTINYKDSNLISNWAYESVMLVSTKEIMQGNNNFFKPKDNITVQQALITIFRIY